MLVSTVALPWLPAFTASMTTNSMNPPNVEANSPTSLLVSSFLVRANEGRTLRAFGHAVVILLDGKQTGEKFTTLLVISPPGGGPGPHYTTAKTNGSIS